MDLQIRKSYKFCYEAKLNFLDWASCATPLKPGRKFSTYLAQSKLHPGEFIKYLHQLLFVTTLIIVLYCVFPSFNHCQLLRIMTLKKTLLEK